MTAARKAMTRSSRADVSSRLPGKAPADGAPRGGVNQRLQALLPKLVLSPSVFLVLVFVYGFIASSTTTAPACSPPIRSTTRGGSRSATATAT